MTSKSRGPGAGQRGAKGLHGVEVSVIEGKGREVDRNGDRRWVCGGGLEEVTRGGKGDSKAQRCSEQVCAAAVCGKDRKVGLERGDGVHGGSEGPRRKQGRGTEEGATSTRRAVSSRGSIRWICRLERESRGYQRRVQMR